MEINLKGKTAIVAGGGGGIGFAISEIFAKAGAEVTVLDVKLDALKGSSEIKGQEIDLMRVDKIRDAIHQIGQYNGIHILVHSAGINLGKPFEEISETDWDMIQSVNLKSCFFLAQAALPFMKKNMGGSIIFISSCSARLGYPGLTPYCASKGGIEAMVRGLACDVAPFNIRANAIAPGTTKTAMTKSLWQDSSKCVAHEATIPLGRLGEVKDIAMAALFLASDLSPYISGTILNVDGGLTAMQQDFVDLKLRNAHK